MSEELKKYYQMNEVSEDEAKHLGEVTVVYEKDGKYYMLGWGHEISTLAEDRVTILYNTDIEGVVEAKDDAEAAEKFGLTAIEPEKPEA